jgi:hypothetical protein
VVDCFLESELKGSIVEITVHKGCRETVLSVDGVENPTIEVIKAALLKIIDCGDVSLYRMLLDVVDVEGVDSDGFMCGQCGDFVYSSSLSV